MKTLLLVVAGVLVFFITGCVTTGEHSLIKEEYRSPQTGAVSDEKKTDLSFQEIPRKGELPLYSYKEKNWKEYIIGADDIIEIKVLQDERINTTQEAQPDGKITLFYAGDIRAAGLTPAQLREEVIERLRKYIQTPQVTVRVSGYKSKKVYIFGEIKLPGIFPLKGDTGLLDAIAHVGGLTTDADIRGGLLLRNNRYIPVDFEALLKKGDLSQNVLLQPEDIVFFPNLLDKKVFVLGEVNRPGVYNIRREMSLVEAVSLAGGFTNDARLDSVMLIRGGLNNPKASKLDLEDPEKKSIFLSLPLETQDIVYVSPTGIAKVERFFNRFHSIIEPIVWAERAIILGPKVGKSLKGEEVKGVIE